jgi:hypothetical protein
MARTLTAALLAALAMCVSAAARTPQAQHVFDTSVIPPLTDGDRYVLWTSAASSRLNVLDTIRQRRWSIPKPRACSWARDAQQTMTAVDGAALLSCADGASRLVNLRSRSIRPLPRSATYFGLGQRWIQAAAAGPAAVSRATGELRRVPTDDRGLPAYDSDLDDPDLGPLCGRGRTTSDWAGQRSAADGWRTSQSSTGASIIHRCGGGARHFVLSRHRVGSLGVSAGVVTWLDSDRGPSALDLATGRRWRWPVSHAYGVLHTRNAVCSPRPSARRTAPAPRAPALPRGGCGSRG